jgi:hypothetical protein
VSQRRAVVGFAVAASTMMLGACGFQSPAVTDHEHNSIQGQDFSVGSMRVRNAHITTEISSSGPKAYLVVTLVNAGTRRDSLTGVTSTDGSVNLTGEGVFDGQLAVPPKGATPVSIQEPLADPAGPIAELAASTTPGAGTYVPMTFSFGAAGSSPVEQIPVVPSTETTAATTAIPTTQATPPVVAGERASD